MFYKALGFAVWKLGIAYLRRRYGRQLKIAGVLAIASIAAAAYVASRSDSGS
jgi:hypothetical protein